MSELEFQSIKSFNLLRIFKRQHSIKISICQNIIEEKKWVGYEIFLRSYVIGAQNRVELVSVYDFEGGGPRRLQDNLKTEECKKEDARGYSGKRLGLVRRKKYKTKA